MPSAALEEELLLIDDPEIYDAEENKINAAVVESSINVENRDIKNEMVFKSNPGFIFHLSRLNVQMKLEERVHAVWRVAPSDRAFRPCGLPSGVAYQWIERSGGRVLQTF
ncbi:hypothetical protein BDR07DRAFT_1497187 [Suillus spraguei]|nr:hypothetical protein BDR07DRAFT_1497187 [Suillus spraguei]